MEQRQRDLEEQRRLARQYFPEGEQDDLPPYPGEPQMQVPKPPPSYS